MALRVQSIPDFPSSRLADPRLWVAVLAIATVGLSGLIARDVYFPPSASTAAVRWVAVQPTTVRSAVSGTGNVVPSTQAFVAFKVAGQLTEVDVKVGDKVSAGQVLAKVDTTTLQAAVDTATANVQTAQANLDAVLTPLSAEQLAQLQHALANAQQSLTDTTNSVNLTNQQDANTLAADQATLAADQNLLQVDQNALNANAIFQIDKQKQAYDQQLLNDAINTYNITHHCTAPTPTLSPCQTDYAAIVAAQTQLANDNQKLNSDQAQVTADAARVASDQAKVAQDQAKQSTDQVAGQQKINSALNAITQAQDSLNTQSTVKATTLTSAQSALANAQTALTTAQTNLGYATLTSPSAGIVMSINGQPGENVNTTTGVTAQSPGSVAPLTATTSGSSFMVLSGAGSFQAQAPFAETDSAKVQPIQVATITFDAIGGLTIPAHVLAVAPNSTVTSSVVNYLVTFTLDRTDPRIKSGMTVNISVTINQVANALAVVSSAIHRSAGTIYVTVLKNGRQQNVPVTLGLVGDTSTQVLTGLSAGDKVVLPTVSVGTGTNRGTGGGILGTGGGGGGRGPGG